MSSYCLIDIDTVAKECPYEYLALKLKIRELPAIIWWNFEIIFRAGIGGVEEREYSLGEAVALLKENTGMLQEQIGLWEREIEDFFEKFENLRSAFKKKTGIVIKPLGYYKNLSVTEIGNEYEFYFEDKLEPVWISDIVLADELKKEKIQSNYYAVEKLEEALFVFKKETQDILQEFSKQYWITPKLMHIDNKNEDIGLFLDAQLKNLFENGTQTDLHFTVDLMDGPEVKNDFRLILFTKNRGYNSY